MNGGRAIGWTTFALFVTFWIAWIWGYRTCAFPAVPVPTPTPRIVTRIVYVYKRADDVNAMWYKAGGYCRGDNGASALILFHDLPVNWETLCGGGHESYTDGGVRYAVPK